MTDKTPQNKAETPVTLAGTTDTARDSEPKSRALPQADALKARFKAGSIPLQTDFADVIDLANMGRQAVGGAEGQTGPANGFTLSSEGRLELKPNAAKGISVDQDGVAVKIGKGMRMSSTGLVEPDVGSHSLGSVEEGTDYSPVKVNSSTNGLVVDLHQGLINTDLGLSVNVKDGLQLDSAGVGVKAGNGVAVNSSGVNIKLAKGARDNGGGGQGEDGFFSIGSAGGLALSSNGLSVDAGNGIQIDGKGVSIKLAANSGLHADETNGLTLVAEQKFQKGMIMMFSGTSIPLGWALCDGNNGTPNLIDRFVMGGMLDDVHGQSTNKFSGGMNTKNIVFTTKQSSVNISGSTQGHALTAEENGPHSHYAGIAVEHTSKCLNGKRNLGYSVDWLNAGGSSKDPNKYEPRVQADGSGKMHSHDISLISGPHDHANELTVPYYMLAFIMKL